MTSSTLPFIVLAVVLCQVQTREISRREEKRLPGGWRTIDPSNVPQEVQSHVKQTLIREFNFEQGIKSIEITRAKVQTVSGQNFELYLQLHSAQCSSSSATAARQQEPRDESACPLITCVVRVHYLAWVNNMKLETSNCAPSSS